MIQALISAKAGIVAFPSAHGYSIERLDNGETYNAHLGIIPRIFQGCDDVLEARFVNENAARQAAILEWQADRGLFYFLLALEADSSEEEVLDFATTANDLFENSPQAVAVAERRLFSRGLPHSIPFSQLKEIFKDLPFVSGLLTRVVDMQPAIQRVADAFDMIPAEVLSDDRLLFRAAAVQRGMFRTLALACWHNESLDLAAFNLYKELSSFPNSRSIIKHWTGSFDKTKRFVRNFDALKEGDAPARSEDFARAGGRAAFERAFLQQKAIIEQLKAGDENRARAFAEEMVNQQKRESQPEHLAKSLTSISTKAREIQAYGVSLDWAFEATLVKSDDARAWAHVAEALVHFGRYTEALNAIEQGEPFGEGFFFLTLRARILRLQRHLPEALDAYRHAAAKTKGTIEEPYNIAGEAEVLRDMGRLDDALKVYREGVDQFPHMDGMLNGYAATLAEAGNLEAALNAYNEALLLAPSIVGENGLATVLRMLGQIPEAEEMFRQIVDRAPFDVISRCGLAECRFDRGDYAGAITVAREAFDRFPESVDAAQLLATLLFRSGKKEDAIALLEEAVTRFPYAPSLISSMARAERAFGRYDEALRLYELGLNKFAGEKEMENGRAAMLRRLGRIEEAVEIYDRILKLSSNAQFARNAKASILIHSRMYQQAFELLDGGSERTNNPRTEDEWRAFLLLSHLDRKTGYTEQAKDRLQWAIDNCSFIRVVRIFEASLASLLLVEGEHDKAELLLDNVQKDYTAIVKLHSLAVKRDTVAVSNLYRAMNDNFLPKSYDDVASELAILGGAISRPRRYTDEHLFEREYEVLLLEAA